MENLDINSGADLGTEPWWAEDAEETLSCSYCEEETETVNENGRCEECAAEGF